MRNDNVLTKLVELELVIKHLPGRHNQKLHTPHKYGSGVAKLLGVRQVREYMSKFDGRTGLKDSDIEYQRQVILEASASGEEALVDVRTWRFNPKDIRDNPELEYVKGGDAALRNRMDAVLSGDASEDDVKAMAVIYGYTQQRLAELDYMSGGSMDVYRGLVLSKKEAKAMQEGQLLEVGSIGHWSEEQAVSSEYAAGRHFKKAMGSKESVILHRNIKPEDILVYDGGVVGGANLAPVDEHEIVPIATRPLRVTRVEERVYNSDTDRMEKHVWLE